MKIISTVKTDTALMQTGNALYVVEYTTTDGKLNRIQVTVKKPVTDDTPTEDAPILGYIYLDHGNISCNLFGNVGLASLFGDFEAIVETVRDQVGEEKAAG